MSTKPETTIECYLPFGKLVTGTGCSLARQSAPGNKRQMHPRYAPLLEHKLWPEFYKMWRWLVHGQCLLWRVHRPVAWLDAGGASVLTPPDIRFNLERIRQRYLLTIRHAGGMLMALCKNSDRPWWPGYLFTKWCCVWGSTNFSVNSSLSSPGQSYLILNTSLSYSPFSTSSIISLPIILCTYELLTRKWHSVNRPYLKRRPPTK